MAIASVIHTQPPFDAHTNKKRKAMSSGSVPHTKVSKSEYSSSPSTSLSSPGSFTPSPPTGPSTPSSFAASTISPSSANSFMPSPPTGTYTPPAFTARTVPPSSVNISMPPPPSGALKPPRSAEPQRKEPSPASYLHLTPIYIPQTTFVSLADIDVDHILAAQAFPIMFSAETLAAGLAQGCSAGAVKAYLQSYPRSQVEQRISMLVKYCHPVLFYAIERNCVDCVRLLLEHGCSPKALDVYNVPALAFAVMRSFWTCVNPTEVVKTLLGLGAEPESVPKDMWEHFLEPPAVAVPTTTDLKNNPLASWSTHYHRKVLAATLNLSTRYFLHKASQLTRTKARGMQLAEAHGYMSLLEVPYLVVGQTFACNFVVDHVTSHIGMNIRSPLVLTFAGLSGHGKTELAKQMGALLKVSTTVVDCAQMRSDTGLFGARIGYANNQRGSQLNNFISDHDGERSVVFLDEFDKTELEVRNSLLLLLDSGEYHDRRTNKPVNATKTIWVLATNLGDEAITQFYKERMEGVTHAEKAKIPHKLLQIQLKALFRDEFGAPMAGRMKNVAPFYPFDHAEQAVVAHKFLLELVDQLRQPIDLSPSTKRYPAHIHLAIKNDGKLCKHIAEESYISELGARSLTSGIDDIRRDFYTTFINTGILVSDQMNDGPLMKYTVQLVPVAGLCDISEVTVAREGFANYYRGQAQKMVEPLDDKSMVGEVEDLCEAVGNMMGSK
ncbi:hypothetical protein LTR08_002092 [Meristemomyces frigidus]|nr:hypothetical protein LTR08_002092 [Meristemomyces frigidus]